MIGHFTTQSKARLLALIEQYAQTAGIDGVILGCTELPLLLKQDDCRIKLFDTLDLHVTAALDFALAGKFV